LCTSPKSELGAVDGYTSPANHDTYRPDRNFMVPLQIGKSRVYPLESTTLDLERDRHLSADSYIYCAVPLGHEIAQRPLGSDRSVHLECYAHLEYRVDLTTHNMRWEPELRDPVPQHAARLGGGLENCNIVTTQP